MKKDYLDMIQRVIDRMGNNSFLLKGWAILVIIAIFTLVGEHSENNIDCILVTNVPLIVFWFLDTYYLQLERKYRFLYDYVRLKKDKLIDFDMNPNKVKLTISESKKVCYFNCLLSKTEVLFYITCIITTFLVYIFA